MEKISIKAFLTDKDLKEFPKKAFLTDKDLKESPKNHSWQTNMEKKST
jgi:hypothetical protein